MIRSEQVPILVSPPLLEEKAWVSTAFLTDRLVWGKVMGTPQGLRAYPRNL